MRQRALEREGEREQVRKKCDGNLVPSLWFPSLAVARIRSGGKREREMESDERPFFTTCFAALALSHRESPVRISRSLLLSQVLDSLLSLSSFTPAAAAALVSDVLSLA